MEAIKTSYWRIKGPLWIGEVIRPQGREYTLLATENYTTKTGRASNLLTWKGKCTVCGDGFTFKTGMSNFHPTATCERHRPGGGFV